jgi:hypothetical protein
MKKLLFGIMAVFVFAGVVCAEWDVTTPAGTEAKSLGDDRIREFKTDIQTALQAEGTFPGVDTSNPRYYWNPSTGTTAQRPSGSTEAVNGRVFINTSSNTLEIYNGSSWDAYNLVGSSQITEVEISTKIAGDALTGGGGSALDVAVDTNVFSVSNDKIEMNDHPTLTTAKFLAFNSVDDDNVTGDNTEYSVEFDSEVYDVGGDYDNSTDVFTAPATGYYHLCATVRFDNSLGTGITKTLKITTSNRTYYKTISHTVSIGEVNLVLDLCVDADMEQSDTASVDLTVDGVGSDAVDVQGHATQMLTFFSGHWIP